MQRAGKARYWGMGTALALLLAAQAAADVDNSTLGNETGGADWGAYGRTFSEQRFSPLDQINKQNVGKLGLAWSLQLAVVLLRSRRAPWSFSKCASSICRARPCW